MKNELFIIVLMITQISCNNKNEKAMLNQSETINEKIIQQYFEHFNNHEWQKMAELYANTVEIKDPAMGIQVVKFSQSDIVKKYVELQQMIPDVRDSIVNIYHANEHIIVEFLSKGTAPDGKKFTLPICTIFEMKDGKIVKDFTYYDNF
ncbi:MAG TPA: nuclear transport factor 2 family protein [Saprospiraceae bacterium]|nr:nuclear transport factor 2 family protein [Saprospiraceae bacterium]